MEKRTYVRSLAPNVKNPPPDEMHFMLMRRGTPVQVEQLQELRCGRTFDVQGRRYQVARVQLGDLKRVIEIGKYVG